MKELSKGYSERGARMGRTSVNQCDEDAPRVYLNRRYLDAGGYDQGGAYWGHGAPLYNAYTEDGSFDIWLRALTREHAKTVIRAQIPGARFFN